MCAEIHTPRAALPLLLFRGVQPKQGPFARLWRPKTGRVGSEEEVSLLVARWAVANPPSLFVPGLKRSQLVLPLWCL